MADLDSEQSATGGWVNGLSHDYGYDRYGDSPYYDVPEGWAIIAFHDWAGDYEFDMVVVWQHKETGEVRAAYDAGCSCPTPFSDLTIEGMLVVSKVDDLKPLVEKAGEWEDWGWDAPDDGLAEIKARVHRALRDGFKPATEITEKW